MRDYIEHLVDRIYTSDNTCEKKKDQRCVTTSINGMFTSVCSDVIERYAGNKKNEECFLRETKKYMGPFTTSEYCKLL